MRLLPPPLNPCTCALVAIVVLAGCRLALSFSIFVALNGMAVTHIVPRATAGTTSSIAHTPRAVRLDTPRDVEYAISQLGQDIRANGADDDDDDDDDGGGADDDAILTRRPTRRDGARDGVRPLGLADPPVPIESINADVDALDARKVRAARKETRVRARTATDEPLSLSLSSPPAI